MVMDPGVARRRHEAILRLRLLERQGDEALTALLRVAKHITGADAAAIHIIDAAFQHRIAGINAPLGTHPRDDAMCPLVVDLDEGVVLDDATADSRFAFSSFTRDPDAVRFYASLPLRSDDLAVGTVCLFDTVARTLTTEQRDLLDDLALVATAQLQLGQVARDLDAVATRDPLTGVANRLAVVDRFEHAQTRVARRGGSVLVAVADIDSFKAINDLHGHAIGDAVLRAVAERLRGAVRGEDTVGRLGGDEFVVIAEVEHGGMQPVKARLEERMATPIAVSGGGTATVTIGTVLAERGDDLAGAMARADAAMYARKPGAR